MTHRRRLVLVAALCAPRLAVGGGLFLPGSGAVSTSRAGAAVASTDDAEAFALNPAGIAKATGTTITVSAAILSYAMEFQRRGSYDAVPGEPYPFAGQAYPTVQNDVSPPLGIGSFQPVPAIGVISDLGGVVPGLHVGIGLYAPNAYPFRDLCTKLATGCEKYQFNGDYNTPPPSTRYDIMKQEAAVILPSLVVAYRVAPALDVGVRLSAGQATLKSTTALWGVPGNYAEDVKQDSVFVVDAKDSFVPAFGVGVTYRPTPAIELGANYSSELAIHARGSASSVNGPSVAINGNAPAILPVADLDARCAAGGTQAALSTCVDFALPMTAQLGGRYKFLDAQGRLKGDVELDLDWEHWGKACDGAAFDDGSCASTSDYRVVVDAQAVINNNLDAGIPLKTSVVRHGLRDTYGIRLGGSYHLAVGAPREDHTSSEVILRGGLGYDTAAAKTGWLRADYDGAARTTLAVGAAYRGRRFEVSAGGGVTLEGSPSNPNVGGGAEPCNPTQGRGAGCAGTGTDTAIPDRQGPDPINPISPPDSQFQNPINQGDYRSRYVLLMLGVTTWF